MGEAMNTKKIIICIMGLMFTGVSADLHANFANTFGFSAEGLSRGNAMTAVVNDWTSVWYNVGGLGKGRANAGTSSVSREGEMTLKLRKTEGESETRSESYPNCFGVTVLFIYPQLNLDIQRFATTAGGDYVPVKTKAAKMDPYGFLVLGGALDLNTIVKLPDFVSSCRLGLGLGTNWDGSLVKVNDLDPRTHNFLRYGREIQTSIIVVGLGIGFMNDAFGGGVGANVAFAGQASAIMETQLTGDPQIPLAQATMDLSIAPAAIAGIYFSPGKFYSPIDGLDIGASYRMETKMKIDPFNAAAVLFNGSINMNLMLAIVDYYTPHTITGGIAYTRWGVTLSADVNWELWSKNYVSKVLKFHYFGLPEFEDTLSYKVGVKYKTPLTLFGLAIMGGYSYVPSILADNAGTTMGIRIGTVSNSLATGMFNYMDNDKHIASLGIEFTVPKMWRLGGEIVISLGYQFQYLVPKSVQKNGIMNTAGAPEDVLDTYLINPSYSYGGMNHGGALSVGMRI